MLLATNLVYPQWVSVKCGEHLLTNVVCFMRQNNSLQFQSKFKVDYVMCENMEIKNLSHCYKFLWIKRHAVKNIRLAENECDFLGMSLSREYNKKFNFILESTAQHTFSLVFKHSIYHNLLMWLFYERVWLTRKYKTKSSTQSQDSGYLVCHRRAEFIVRQNSNTYSCQTGVYVSSAYLCDGINDCTGTQFSNEEECIFDSTPSNTYTCPPLQYLSKDRKCSMYLDQHMYKRKRLKNQQNYLLCSNSFNFHNPLENNLCKENFKDKDLIKSNMKNEFSTKCPMEGQLPCNTVHIQCYNISDICLYRLDDLKYLHPCKSGAHIQQCKDFECHQHFKCPKYFCIPWAYICDGKWDCPDGHDETFQHGCGRQRLCTNQFKCRSSQVCIHIHDICNHILDCPHHDDEILCELKDFKCPKKCVCLNYALRCSELTLQFQSLYNLPYVAFHLVAVSMASVSFLKLNKFIMVLNVSQNEITDICNDNVYPSNIRRVDFSWNNIQKLSKNCFDNLVNLNEIILHRNKIFLLKAKSFHNLNSVSIDLSGNSLQRLSKGIFYNISKLSYLKIYDNPLTNIHFGVLSNIHLEILSTSNFYFCCIISSSMACVAKKNWSMTCSNLLPVFSIKLAFATVSFLVITVNVLSLLQKYKSISRKSQSKVYNSIICFINAGDLIYGIYLAILCIADFLMGKTFLIMHNTWLNGLPCFLAFTSVLFFSFVVPYFLCLLSLARLMVVVFPLESKFKSFKFIVRYALTGVFTIGIIVLIMVGHIAKNEHIPDSLCLPFLDPYDTVFEIQIFTGIVTIWQILVFIFITTVYSILVTALKKMEKNDFLETKRIDQHVIFKLVLVTILNIMGWIPSSVIFITLLKLPTYPITLPYWVTVAIVPLNSIINPLLLQLVSKKRSKSVKRVSSTKEGPKSVTQLSSY